MERNAEPNYVNIKNGFELLALNCFKVFPSLIDTEEISRAISLDPERTWNLTKETLELLVSNLEWNYFNLGPISNVFQEDPEAIEALQIVSSSKACHLSTLIIRRKYDSMQPYHIHKLLRWSIGNCRALTELQIHSYSFFIKCVTAMCKNLKSLKLLDVKIQYEKLDVFTRPFLELNVSDVKFRQNFKDVFKNLEIFRFTSLPRMTKRKRDPHSAYELQRKLMRFCMSLLPSIKYLGDPNLFTDMSEAVIHQAGNSWLEVMTIKMNAPEPFDVEDFSKFRSVKSLSIMFHDMDYPPVNPNLHSLRTLLCPISTLCLTDLHTCAYLEFLLYHFGSGLKQLRLSLNNAKISTLRLALIYFTCPDLEELEIRNMLRLDDDGAWCLRHFERLRSVVLEMPYNSFETKNVRLSDIFAIPNLEEVSLNSLSVEENDLIATISMVMKNPDILCKIKKLYLVVNAPQERKEKKRYREYCDALGIAIRAKLNPGGFYRIYLKDNPTVIYV
ncbi:Hypothetical predicted protein [Cloeon dipterum]|nr:Hypothetical predicted protein [Cloeon dipterum]